MVTDLFLRYPQGVAPFYDGRHFTLRREALLHQRRADPHPSAPLFPERCILNNQTSARPWIAPTTAPMAARVATARKMGLLYEE